MLDRVSEESFEAVHALMAQIKAMLATMTSDQKRIETVTSKAQTKLKPGVMDASVKLKQGSTGKKRGPAKNVPARLEAVTAPSDIAFVVVVVGGRKYIEFLNRKARLPKEWQELYILVTAGRVPQSWMKVFEDSVHLTEEKKQAAAYMKY